MMKMAREFNNILDECLERVLRKGETVEQCLTVYPEYAAELEPLLQTALDTKEITAIKPRPEFREKASYQFQAALREMEPKKSRAFLNWQPRWATAVIVIVVLLLAGSGTVVAAGSSLPDDPLYQVKIATEAVRLKLTPSALGKAELYVKLADKRVAEIIEMADKGEVKQVEITTQRLNAQLVAMANLPVPGGVEKTEKQLATFEAKPAQMAGEEVPAAEVEEPSQAQVREAPPAAVKGVPPPVIKAPAPSIEEAPSAAIEEAPALAAPRAPGASEGVGSAKTNIGNGRADQSVKTGKQAELRVVLSSHAAENQEALQEVLERVPESVKPALRQAIEVAGAGYEQALRNLD